MWDDDDDDTGMRVSMGVDPGEAKQSQRDQRQLQQQRFNQQKQGTMTASNGAQDRLARKVVEEEASHTETDVSFEDESSFESFE